MKIPEVRTVSEEYEKIGTELIEKHFLLSDLLHFVKNDRIKIIYLSSTKAKKAAYGTIYGDCEKVPDSRRWAIDADFLITIYAPNVEGFTEEQKKVLILHELMHVGVEMSEKGDISKHIVPHSVQDFKYILSKYGLDWEFPGKQLEFCFD